MIQDNTAKWKVKKVSSLTTSNGIPVGFEYISMNPNIPQGSLPMFGGLYDRSVYADLWAWVQQQAGYVITEEDWQSYFISNEGNVPFYSDGDGSTTFRVPSINCWVKGASGIEEVGSYLEAGLPNIGGTFSIKLTEGQIRPTMDTLGGAFYTEGVYGSTLKDIALDTINSYNHVLRMDASRSNAIYGNSDTVQPKTIVGMWLVKAYGTISNVGNVETSDILQAIENSKIMLKVW